MRRASSSGDDHTNAATSRITGVIGRPVRRPMRRSHVDLVVNSKIVQRFSRLTHDLEITIETSGLLIHPLWEAGNSKLLLHRPRRNVPPIVRALEADLSNCLIRPLN